MNHADTQRKNVSGRGGSKCKGPVHRNMPGNQLEQSDQQEGRVATRSESQVPPGGALAAATPRDAGVNGV